MASLKSGARLTPADLKSFGRKFCADLEALILPHGCRAVPLPEWPEVEEGPQDGALVQPLKYKGRELGYLMVFPAGGAPPAPELVALLPRAAAQALEALRLRKALAVDRETGLFNRDYFFSRLPKILRGRPREAARSLALDGGDEMELNLVLAEIGRTEEDGAVLAAWAARLSEGLTARNMARLGRRRLAFLTEGRPEEIRRLLSAARAEQSAAAPDSRPVMAWAAYPADLGGQGAAAATAGRFRRLARLWLNRALAALLQARQDRSGAVAFRDILQNCGRIIQVLPLDRAVINLGREAGAAAGQVFLVNSPGEAGLEADYKGEALLFEVAEGYSLGRLTAAQFARRVEAGDALTFSRQDEAALSQGEALPASLAELPAPEDFLEAVVSQSGPLALALARLDGFERNAGLWGREEAGRRLAPVFEKVLAVRPAPALKSLWRADTLALAWPDSTREELGPALYGLAASLRAFEPVSFGLAFSAPGAAGGAAGGAGRALLDDADKALREAAFSGPGQVAVFGPLALNISGDRLFEGGDLSGALREYERGLALAPEHVNLLNSLGVCLGRLGRMREALAAFQKIAELAPDNMMAHYNIGYAHLQAGRLPEAETALMRAAELAPENFETLFHLGRTALELGHLDRALPALKRAGQAGEDRPLVFRLLGEALLLTHDYPAALIAFKKAVKLAPNDAYALSALGTLFMDFSGDLPVARSLLQRSAELDPENSLYRRRLGRLLFVMGDFDGAERQLLASLAGGGQAPEARYYLGRAAAETGRPDEARGHFEAALAQDPSYKPALEELEKLNGQDGDGR